MNKLIVILSLTLIGAISQAETYLVNGKEVSKKEAMREAIQNPDVKIQRVQDVQLTDKLTFKVVKQAKNK